MTTSSRLTGTSSVLVSVWTSLRTVTSPVSTGRFSAWSRSSFTSMVSPAWPEVAWAGTEAEPVAARGVAAAEGPAGHVVGPEPAEDVGGLIGQAIGRDRDDGAARFQFIVIILGLVLGQAGPNEGPDEAGDPGPCGGIGHDDTESAGGDGRADDGDDPGEDARGRRGPRGPGRSGPRSRPPSRHAIHPHRPRW